MQASIAPTYATYAEIVSRNYLGRRSTNRPLVDKHDRRFYKLILRDLFAVGSQLIGADRFI